MMGVNYKTKSELKASVGKPLEYEETSAFGSEYKPDGIFCVVHSPYVKRDWFAEITMENGLIKKVK
jgi:hypothetical protein